MFRGKYEWSVLPKNNPDCHCLNISNNSNCVIYPNRVNVIDLEILASTHSWKILRIVNHMCQKPWRVLTNFLFQCPITGTFKAPVISRTKCFIQRGDILCHALPMDMELTYYTITGT